MKKFEWTDELSVNVEEIDSQHREFIRLTNELSYAINAGIEDEVLGETIAALVDYANWHFTSEERLMKVHGYPDLEIHAKEHDELKDTLLKINRRFKAEQLAHAATVAVFLEDWIINHLKTTDKKYSSFFNSKGVF